MTSTELNSKFVLTELIEEIRRRIPELEIAVLEAINQGKDVERTLGKNESISSRKDVGIGYHERVALEPDEALEAAIEVMRSYFVEIPMMINSANENFFTTSISESTGDTEADPKSHDLKIKIEFEIGGVGDFISQDNKFIDLREIDFESIDKRKQLLDNFLNLVLPKKAESYK